MTKWHLFCSIVFQLVFFTSSHIQGSKSAQKSVIPFATDDYNCNPANSCKSQSPGSLVVDPSDCHKFYVCVIRNGEVTNSDSSLYCPFGQYFNSYTLQCETKTTPCTVSDSKGSCSYTCVAPNQYVGFPGDCRNYYVCAYGGRKILATCPTEMPFFNGNGCTSDSSQCCDFCNPSCKEVGVQIPDPQDCRKYYICLVAGQPDETMHFSCLANEVFLPEVGTCVPGNTCSPICTPEPTTSYPYPTTTYPTTTTPYITTTPTDDYNCNPANSCKSQSPGSLVVDPSDCHKFYVCVIINGEVTNSDSSLYCPFDQYFNSYTLQCETETTPCTVPDCKGSCSLTCLAPNQYVGFPGDCRNYYVCAYGGGKIFATCPTEMPFFNGNGCTSDSSQCCDFCNPSCNEVGVQIPDPQDCRKYYICLVVGQPDETMHFSCLANEVFLPEVGTCVPGNTCTPICIPEQTTSDPYRTTPPADTDPPLLTYISSATTSDTYPTTIIITTPYPSTSATSTKISTITLSDTYPPKTIITTPYPRTTTTSTKSTKISRTSSDTYPPTTILTTP